jgi:tRNA A-37 threonylcarbamoyl transferase component Bud32/tetratricopeptide (TPR) repeat protein
MTAWRGLPDRFRTRQVIAKGPQSGVLLADDLSNRSLVLVRVLPARWLGTDLTEHLEDAARRLVAAESILGVVVPRLEISRSGRVAFIVRQFVRGQTLAECVDGSDQGVATYLEVATSAVRGMCFLHAAGITHGNIKASNLVLCSRGVALLDYGLAPLSALLDFKDQFPAEPPASAAESQTADIAAMGALLCKTFERILTRAQATASSSHYELNVLARMVLRRLAGFDGCYDVLEAAVQDLEHLVVAYHSGELDGVSIGAHDVRRALGQAVFVARPYEWQQLTEALERSATERAQSLYVEGPAGIGKTRLLREFARWAQAERGARLIYVKNEQAVASRPHAVRSALVHALRPPHERQDFSTVAPDDGAGADGTQIPDAVRTDEAARRVAVRLGELAVASQPLLVVVDDCHFAHHEDLQLLRRLATLTPTIGRDVVLMFASRGVSNSVVESPAIETDRIIRMVSMQPDGVRSILTSMAGKLDDHVVEEVISWAQGNPLHAENAIHFLVDNGSVIPGPQGWARHGHLPVPPDVLTRRVGSLPPALRSILKVAAVIGFRGRIDILARAAGASPGWCNATLGELARRGLVHVQTSPGVTNGESAVFAFAHDTVRDVALADDEGPELSEIHRRVAHSLLDQGCNDEFDLAFHLARGGDPEAAYPHAVAAARIARSRYSLDTACEYYELALSVRTTYELLRELGEALMLEGRYPAAIDALRQALAWCPGSDTVAEAEVLRLLGETLFKSSRQKQAEHCLLAALRALDERVPRTDFGFVVALAAQVIRLSRVGRMTIRHRSRTSESAGLKSAIFGNLAYCWFFQNSVRAMWAQARQMAMARACAVGGPERAHACATHAVLSSAQLGLGRRGARYGERALSIRARQGDEWGEAHALHLCGVALVASGESRRALDLLTAAAERFDRTADRWEAHTSRWHRALALYQLGEREAACQEAAAAGEMAEAISDRQTSVIAFTFNALAGSGETEKPQPVPQDDFDGMTTVLYLLGRAVVRLEANDLTAAGEVLDQATSEIRRRRLINTYVAPVLSWRATVTRWRAESEPSGSSAARRWAVRAAMRAIVAAAVSVVYRTERVQALGEMGRAPGVIRHAFIRQGA